MADWGRASPPTVGWPSGSLSTAVSSAKACLFLVCGYSTLGTWPVVQLQCLFSSMWPRKSSSGKSTDLDPEFARVPASLVLFRCAIEELPLSMSFSVA